MNLRKVMNIKNILIGIILVFLMMNTMLLISYSKNSNKLKHTEKEIFKLKHTSLKVVEEQLVIDKTVKILTEKMQQIIPDSLKGNNYLVFVFYNGGCDPCIKKEFSRLKKHFNLSESKNVLLLPYFQNSRGLAAKLKSENIFFNYINIWEWMPKNNSIEKSFYFFLDKNCNVHIPFAPNSNLPDASEYYYNIVKQVINKNTM